MEGYNSIYNPAHIDSAEAWDLVNSYAGAVVLDVRSAASYQESHVSAAVSVPYDTLAAYANANLPDKDRVIICYCFCGDKGGAALSAYNLLSGLGYTKVYYTEPGGEWSYEGTAVTSSPAAAAARRMVSGAEAKALYDANAGAILLDVRGQDEYDAGHIAGSKLIPLAELGGRLSELPDKGAVIIVYCQSGLRSGAAYDLLVKSGYTRVYDMESVGKWGDGLVTG